MPHFFIFTYIFADTLKKENSNMNNRLLDVKLAFKIYDKRKSSFIGNLISMWTNSVYYHVELIVGDQWISANSEAGGITIAPLRELNYNWDYKHLGQIEVTESQYLNFVQFIDDNRTCKYDWLGILFSQVLPFRWNSKDKWFCSEIVTKLLQLLVVKEVNEVIPADMSPKDLAVLFNYNKKRFGKD